MAQKNKGTLTDGPIARTLFNLTLPMFFGLLGMVAFNLADTYFIGQLGTAELAAISFTFPVVMMVFSIAMGLGVGTSTVVSRAIGEGDGAKVKRLTTDSIILSILVVAIFVVIGILTIEPLFTLLGAPSTVLPLIQEYMLIWYLGMIAVVVPMVGNNATRATGDTQTPSIIMTVSVVINIILDPLLIFGWGPVPGMGLTGAALATVISRFLTLVVAIWLLHRDAMLTFERPQMKVMWQSWQAVLYVGIPTAATDIISPVATGIVTKLIASYGTAAVAGFGIATRLEMFALMVIMALASVLSPFVGQNWGAKAYDRAVIGVKYSQRFALVWGMLTVIVMPLFAAPLANIFDSNPAVISVVVLYFWIVPLRYGFQGNLKLGTTVLTVLRLPLDAALLNIIQTFALYIPLAYLGSELFGLGGIFGASSISFMITATLAHFWLKRRLLEATEHDFLERVVTSRDKQNTPESVGYWIATVNHYAQLYFQRELAKFNLNYDTLAFMAVLIRHQSLNKAEFRQRLQLDSHTTDYALKQLATLGYIQQVDGQFSLSEAGQQISPEIRNILQNWTNTLGKDFTPAEKEMALSLLKRMHKNVSTELAL